jgi:hypothetical protein
MGLLVSDTMRLDATIDDSNHWQYSLTDYAYLTESSYETDEYETTEQSR